jgi:hypothetical protein
MGVPSLPGSPGTSILILIMNRLPKFSLNKINSKGNIKLITVNLIFVLKKLLAWRARDTRFFGYSLSSSLLALKENKPIVRRFIWQPVNGKPTELRF